ncbi:crotonase/enoyl-CoA hydratase family protein [Nocardioides maradonensis]
MSGRFGVTCDGHVATVELVGAGGKPVMDTAYFAELRETVRALDRDDDVRAIVLTGTGGHFAFGLDLAEAAGSFGRRSTLPGARGRVEFLDEIRDLQDTVTAVAACRKPTIAAIEGWCIGGGVDLAAACDVRISTAGAKFSVREVKVAIVADLGSLQRLVGIIGDGHLRELALTGDDIDAARAERIGLVNTVYADGDALRAAAADLAGRMAANSPLVTSGIKDVLDAERGPRVEAGLRYVAVWNSAFLMSDDLDEAVGAFLEKRPPAYRGQ